jgi:hypothetical protein
MAYRQNSTTRRLNSLSSQLIAPLSPLLPSFSYSSSSSVRSQVRLLLYPPLTAVCHPSTSSPHDKIPLLLLPFHGIYSFFFSFVPSPNGLPLLYLHFTTATIISEHLSSPLPCLSRILNGLSWGAGFALLCCVDRVITLTVNHKRCQCQE